MNAFLTIASKRDTRRYRDEEIPEEVIRRILEAGRVSGNAMNRQQRRFVVLKPETRERAAAMVTRPSNLRGSRLTIAVVAADGQFADFDAGRASQNMMLAAWADGVASCPNAIADQAGIDGLLGVGESERVVTILSFGYPASGLSPDSRPAPEWLRRADRVPLDAVTTTV